MAKKGATAVAEPEEAELTTDEEAPANGKGKVDEVTFGVADVCKLVKKETGKEYTTRDMRSLIRRLARSENPSVKREITPGNRSRYDWSGPKDPEVVAIVKAVKAGGIEAAKKEALDALKEKKAKERAEKGDAKGDKKGKKGKKAKMEEIEED